MKRYRLIHTVEVTGSNPVKLKKILSNGKTLREIALKAGIDEKAVRKYRKTGEMPSD